MAEIRSPGHAFSESEGCNPGTIGQFAISKMAVKLVVQEFYQDSFSAAILDFSKCPRVPGLHPSDPAKAHSEDLKSIEKHWRDLTLRLSTKEACGNQTMYLAVVKAGRGGGIKWPKESG